jgi:PHD/YefM family antitoxin component YafN of YafNO toxin-antitoxin module
MHINTTAIVSNSDMIKSYKACRGKAETLGKIFVIKNNQPDAVLFSVKEYQRLSGVLEYLESLDEKDIAKVMDSLPKPGVRNNYPMEDL